MNKLAIVSVLGLFSLVAVGCNKSPESADPGKNSVDIKAPSMHKTVKQDTSETIELTVEPSKNYKHHMNFKVEVPESAKLQAKLKPDSLDVNGANQKLELVVTAAKDSPPGDYDVTVTGKPDDGQPISVKAKVKVEKH